MKRFAVDIVLLPPDPVMDFAIVWNQMLRKSGPPTIVLDKIQRLPHISLVMGCLNADKLDVARDILQSIASQHPTLELRVPQLKAEETSLGTVVSLDIEWSRQLADLHKSLVDSFKPLLTQDANEEDVNDPSPIANSSLAWINNYIPQHCYDHFWPHITLGFGEPSEILRPFSFKASRLAICHLGNYCTCTSILWETTLGKRGAVENKPDGDSAYG